MTTQAIVKASPSLGFLDIGLLQDLASFQPAIASCANSSDLQAKVSESNAARKLIENLCAACKGAITDLFAARTNERKAEAERIKAAEKRQKELEAARSGDIAERKRKGQQQVGILSYEGDGCASIAKYTVQEFNNLLSMSSNNTMVQLFSQPFIITSVPFIAVMSQGLEGQVQRFKNSFATEKTKGTLRGQLNFTDEAVASAVLHDLEGALFQTP